MTFAIYKFSVASNSNHAQAILKRWLSEHLLLLRNSWAVPIVGHVELSDAKKSPKSGCVKNLLVEIASGEAARSSDTAIFIGGAF